MSQIEIQKIGGYLKVPEPVDQKLITKKEKEYLFDFNNKLILNEEREFSSGFYDIKIYERQYRNDQVSYRFELSLSPPKISNVFITDFQS